MLAGFVKDGKQTSKQKRRDDKHLWKTRVPLVVDYLPLNVLDRFGYGHQEHFAELPNMDGDNLDITSPDDADTAAINESLTASLQVSSSDLPLDLLPLSSTREAAPMALRDLSSTSNSWHTIHVLVCLVVIYFSVQWARRRFWEKGLSKASFYASSFQHWPHFQQQKAFKRCYSENVMDDEVSEISCSIHTRPTPTPEASPEIIKTVTAKAVMDDDDREEVIIPQPVLQDRVTNLVSQNLMLQTAMEEQRATTQRILRELHSRDEFVLSLESSYKKSYQDLSTRLMLAEKRQQESSMARFGVLSLQLDKLWGHVNERDHKWDASKSSQRALNEQFTGHVNDLVGRLDRQEEKERESSRVQQEEKKDMGMNIGNLTQLVNSLKHELGNQCSTMGKLGERLEAKEEQDLIQFGTFLGQIEILAANMEDTKEDLQQQRLQSESFQIDFQTQSKDSSLRLDQLHRNLQEQIDMHGDELKGAQTLFMDLEGAIRNLTVGLQRTKSSIDDLESKQSEFAEELKGVQLQCSAHATQLSLVPPALKDLTTEIEEQRFLHESLQRDWVTRQGETVSRIDAMDSGIELLRQSHDNGHDKGLKVMEGKLSEIENTVQSLDKASSEWVNFQADLHNQLTKSLDQVKSIESEVIAQKGRLEDGLQRSRKDNQAAYNFSKQIQQVSREIQERLDHRLCALKVDFTSQMNDAQNSMKLRDRAQQKCSKAFEESVSVHASKIQQLFDEIQNNRSEYQDLNAALTAAKDTVAAVERRVASQGRLLAGFEEEKALLGSRVEILATESIGCAEKLKSLQQKMSASEKNLAREIGLYEGQLMHLEQQLTKAVSGAHDMFHVVTQDIEHLSKRIKSQKDFILKVQEQTVPVLSELDESVSRLGTDIEGQGTLTQERLQKLDGRSAALEKNVAVLDESISSLGADLEGQRTFTQERFQKLDVRSAALEKNVAGMSDRVDGVQKDLKKSSRDDANSEGNLINKKDKEGKSLSEMSDARKELKARQARSQQEVQARILSTMMQVPRLEFQMQQLRIPRVSSESGLAVRQNFSGSADMSPDRDEDKDDSGAATSSLVGKNSGIPLIAGYQVAKRAGFSMSAGMLAGNLLRPAVMGSFASWGEAPKKKE